MRLWPLPGDRIREPRNERALENNTGGRSPKLETSALLSLVALSSQLLPDSRSRAHPSGEVEMR